MAYRDVTKEFLNTIEGNANDQVFLTVRDFVKVMLEGGQGRRKKQRVKFKNDTNNWHTVEDYDAYYRNWEATKYKRAAEALSLDDAYDNESKRNQVIFAALGVDLSKPVHTTGRREYYEEKLKRL